MTVLQPIGRCRVALSGTTTVARPSTFGTAFTCWIEMRGWFDVDAQTSSRTTVRLCRRALPSPGTEGP